LGKAHDPSALTFTVIAPRNFEPEKEKKHHLEVNGNLRNSIGPFIRHGTWKCTISKMEAASEIIQCNSIVLTTEKCLR
jgi:hypothetical protein